MTIAVDIFAAIGAMVACCWLIVLAAAISIHRQRNAPARQAAMARHPAGGRERHLHSVRGDAA